MCPLERKWYKSNICLSQWRWHLIYYLYSVWLVFSNILYTTFPTWNQINNILTATIQTLTIHQACNIIRTIITLLLPSTICTHALHYTSPLPHLLTTTVYLAMSLPKKGFEDMSSIPQPNETLPIIEPIFKHPSLWCTTLVYRLVAVPC